ncbi:hypothetical protein ACFLZX_03385 [Nanoarchaeota archaeon]
MSLINIGPTVYSSNSPNYASLSKSAKTGPSEAWLDHALRTANTVHDSTSWRTTMLPHHIRDDVMGRGEGTTYLEILTGNAVPDKWAEGWLTPTKILEYVDAKENKGVIRSISGVPFEENFFGHKDAMFAECDPRHVGKFYSMSETVKQDYINFLNSKEGQVLVEKLAETGNHPHDIAYVAGGYLKSQGLKHQCAAVDLRDGIFYENPQLRAIAELLGRQEGMTPQEFIEYTQAHEIAHLFLTNPHDPVEKKEAEVEAFLADFYAALAEGAYKGYHISVPNSERAEAASHKAKEKHARKTVAKIAENGLEHKVEEAEEQEEVEEENVEYNLELEEDYLVAEEQNEEDREYNIEVEDDAQDDSSEEA